MAKVSELTIELKLDTTDFDKKIKAVRKAIAEIFEMKESLQLMDSLTISADADIKNIEDAAKVISGGLREGPTRYT